ncbi:hypothetical protein [Anaerocolumna xylanovorans]|uniref:Uncharacterized protein n=1 Tax=Anaerocolumna xylanovorans DSM 12503 TaxID=1121345 RepID=A0A1M7YIA6_9FIRM|nr:hypothetical protein [Anaerocolumna xylanovorans]SHO52367.1 hypothetical protein SAMN02745217_03614 [Anaerocolumna xylanovorans DSM 12503]
MNSNVSAWYEKREHNIGSGMGREGLLFIIRNLKWQDWTNS